MKKLISILIALTISLSLLLASSPVYASDAGYFHTHNCYVYVARWVWDTSDMGGSWRAPYPALGVYGALDLRGMAEASEPGSKNGDLSGYGVFFLDQSINQKGSFLLGTAVNGNLSINLPPAAKNFLQNRYDIVLESYTVNGTVWELFTQHGDATAQNRWAPLVAEIDGTLRIYINGFSPVVFGKDVPKQPLFHWEFGRYQYYNQFWHRWMWLNGWHTVWNKPRG